MTSMTSMTSMTRMATRVIRLGWEDVGIGLGSHFFLGFRARGTISGTFLPGRNYLKHITRIGDY